MTSDASHHTLARINHLAACGRLILKHFLFIFLSDPRALRYDNNIITLVPTYAIIINHRWVGQFFFIYPYIIVLYRRERPWYNTRAQGKFRRNVCRPRIITCNRIRVVDFLRFFLLIFKHNRYVRSGCSWRTERLSRRFYRNRDETTTFIINGTAIAREVTARYRPTSTHTVFPIGIRHFPLVDSRPSNLSRNT